MMVQVHSQALEYKFINVFLRLDIVVSVHSIFIFLVLNFFNLMTEKHIIIKIPV